MPFEENIMTQRRISIIGNPAFDVIEIPYGEPNRILSGFVFNAAVILAKLGLRVTIIAKVGKGSEKDFHEQVTKYGIHISKVVSAEVSTGFHVQYDEKGNRTLRSLGDAGEITESDICPEFFKSDAVLIGPLLQEISPVTLQYLAGNAPLSLLDPQGLLRKRNAKGFVQTITIKDARLLVEDIDILKLTGEEACLMANSRSIEQASKILSESGPEIVLVTLAERGSLIYREGEEICRIPAYPVQVRDPTGAGDVYAAGFMYEYLMTEDPVRSGFFASATASFMVENQGIAYEIHEGLIRQRVDKLARISEDME